MDITIRKINAEMFRKFKAFCAIQDIALGDGFNAAVEIWMSKAQLNPKNLKEAKNNQHVLNDLGTHLHALHQMEKMKSKVK